MSFVNAAIGVAKVGGAWAQGQSDKMTANTQAMADNYQAQQEEDAAQQQAAIIRRAGMYAASRATAGYAASGVEVGAGSSEEAVNQINTDSTHDAYMTILNATKRGDALKAQGAVGQISAASKARQGLIAAGSNALASGYLNSSRSGWATTGNSYTGLSGGTFANNDLAGTNRGSGD